MVEITQLIHNYAHLADAAKFEPVESEPQQRLALVFTQDGVFDATQVNGGERWGGLDAIREMFARPKPSHTPAHMTTNVYVYEDGDTVRVKSKWQAAYWDREGMRLGDYDDVVVRTADGWRIRERVVTVRHG